MTDTVLLVDDDESNLKILQNLLAVEYELLLANSGEAALDLLKTTVPDAILLDVMMPDVDGITVCKKIMADETLRGVPVIFVTGLDDQHNESVGLKAGGSDYITKPVNPELLKARLKLHIRNRKQSMCLQLALDGAPIEEVRTLVRELDL